MRSNTKEVSKAIQEHILDFYIDYEEDPVATLIHNMNAVNDGRMSDIEALRKLVQNGDFLIYDHDIVDFLNGLGINPENKEYPVEKSRKLYENLIVRESVKLINNFNKNK